MSDRPPNFLFVLADHARYDWLSCHGSVPVRTPNIDALADRGIRLNQTYCNSPLCAPSRACLAAGRRYGRTNVPDNSLDFNPQQPTFMHLLRDGGYRVGACGKLDLWKKSEYKGLEGWTARHGQLGYTDTIDQAGKMDAVRQGSQQPKDAYMAYMHAHGLAQAHHDDYDKRYKTTGGRAAWACPFAREHHTDDFCGRAALQLLDRFPHGEPWHLQVNFPGPHPPYDAPAELLARYDDVTFPLPVNPDPAINADEHQAVRRQFAAMTEGIDEWLGWLIARVAQRGELDRTVIIFSSDHGEMLGDHGRWGKSKPDMTSVRVPLVVAGTGVTAQATSEALVELIDLSATFVDLAGIGVPEYFDGRSLAPLLRGDTRKHRDHATSGLHRFRVIVDERWKLTRYDDGRVELYDHQADAAELHECSAAQADVVRRLLAALDADA